MKDHIKELEAMGACHYARNWAKGFKTAQAAWDKCERPDWMLWYLAKKLERKALCTLLGKIVMDTPLGDGRTVWDIMPEAGRECFRVLRRWIDGQATENELRTANAAAYANAAANAAAYAANAAYAAANAAAYAANAAAYAAAYANAAANAAAYAAAYAAANAATKTKKWQCNLIRQRYPDIEAVRAKAEGGDR